MFDIKGEPGIYQILNKVNNKRYIGSSLRVNRRWTLHLYLLRNNKHHSSHLLAAWNKYGESSFVFECLLYCNQDDLLQLEHKYIVEYNTTDRNFGYNVTEDVEHVAVLSKEDRIKISNSLKGRKWTKELRQRFINSRTGKKIKKSSETKKKQFAEGIVNIVRMGDVSKEKYDEWRRHMSDARKRYFENTMDPIKVPVMLLSENETLYFASIKSAAKYLGVCSDTILNRINKGCPSKKVPYTITRISVEFYKNIKNV